ncbi:MAG: sulfatase-like hydrolase/transferase [Phycisphaerae bacterium]
MPKANRPADIVLIMSDQHNAHVMGCSGNAVARTPAIDALARGGTQFTAAYCPCPLCVPSRMAFMTARYPADVDVWDNDSTLRSDIPTFAHALADGGCEPVLCGRMHFYGRDQFHGFERRLYGDSGHALSREICGAGYNRTNGQTRYAVEVAGYGRTGFEAYDEAVTAKAIEFIRKRGGESSGGGGRGGRRPLCLVVGYTLPHNPLICSRRWFDYYMDRIAEPPPETPEEFARQNIAIRKWRERRGADKITPAQARRATAAYYGLVSEMDQNIARLVEAARSAPGGDRTVVIYTSDHGDMCGEHGMWWKSCYFEGSARVPLIFNGQAIAAGRTVEAVVSLIDVGPTVLEMMGCPPMKSVAGRSLARFLAGDASVGGAPSPAMHDCGMGVSPVRPAGVSPAEPAAGTAARRAGQRPTPHTEPSAERGGVPSGNAPSPADWPNEILCDYHGAHGDKPSCMIRRGDWKLMYYWEFDTYLLFNLREDPGELRDRAADPSCRDIAASLLATIRSRWSAQRVLENQGKEGDQGTTAGMTFPHEVIDPTFPAEDNQFDFSQLPWWGEVRERVRKDTRK